MFVCLYSENEPGWENDIRDDVLEECSQAGSVYHIHVDKQSQGNVYVKCSTTSVATAAFNRLNGRFFAGWYPQCVHNGVIFTGVCADLQASRSWCSIFQRLRTTSSFPLRKQPSLHSSNKFYISTDIAVMYCMCISCCKISVFFWEVLLWQCIRVG